MRTTLLAAVLVLAACASTPEEPPFTVVGDIEARVQQFQRQELGADMSHLSAGDREALDPVQRFRFDWMLNRIIATMENYHFHKRQGAMDPEQWTRMRVVLRAFMSTPGGQAWWSSRRRAEVWSDLADLSFDRFLDQEVERSKSSPPVDSQGAV